jgi:3-oxoacyl-[acyl-carrier protein] reductase
MAMRADVRDAKQVAHMVGQAVATFGTIDVLVSNADMQHVPKPFLDMAWEAFAQKVTDELHAAFTVTKAVLPIMQFMGPIASCSQQKRRTNMSQIESRVSHTEKEGPPWIR